MVKEILFSLCIVYSFYFSAQTIKTTIVAKGLTCPVAMDYPRDGSGRLFICEQTGKIKILKDGKLNEKAFLDISSRLDKIGKVYSEKGLLGLAFHPDYKKNGRFFIYYSAPSNNPGEDHKSIISEFKVSSNPDIASIESERVLMQISQPEGNHNGGNLVFGPDGFLYIGLGDGGGAGDKHGEKGNGQDLTTLLGKIIRIDINGELPYAIPKDNPFVKDKNAKKEIWAYGLRNPWRFSFDRKTGKLFCADVGQNKWEEVNIIEKGKNYGWRLMEGYHCYQPEQNCDPGNLVKPIAEYDHKKGISVTGGYVYRGKSLPEFYGKYIFADWRGNMFFLEEKDSKWLLKDLKIEGKKNNDLDYKINSFGEDAGGELYILAQKTDGAALSTGVLMRVSQGK